MGKWRKHAELLAPLYAQAGWTWGHTHPQTPSADEIEQFIEQLEPSLTKDVGWVHSGRLELWVGDEEESVWGYRGAQLSVHINLD